MGLFDGLLDTASKAFGWLDNNKAALDLISGAAKGFGAYLSYKQGVDQQKFLERKYEDEQRRLEDTTKAPNGYDNTVPLASFEAGKLLSGNMADAMKYRG